MRKTSLTSSLEREAAEMESRLKQLRTKMSEYKEEDDALPRKGGSRWRSAREDRGTVTSYAKTVTESIKSKPAVLAEPKKVPEDYRTMSASRWTGRDVCGWLDHLGLGVYREVFSKNDIIGEVLLELSLDDLDYMGITALGHRKTILRSVEELRRTKKLVIKSSSSKTASSADLSSSKLPMRVGKSSSVDSSSETKGAEKVHWAALEPIESQPVPVPMHRSSDLLRAEEGELDEEAERAAFQAAVMDWRRGAPSEPSAAPGERTLSARPRRSVVEENSLPSDGAEPDGGKVWRNPFGDAVLDEEREHQEFAKAVQSWREGRAGLDEGRRRISDLVESLQEDFSRSIAEKQLAHERAISEVTCKFRAIEVVTREEAKGEESSGDEHLPSLDDAHTSAHYSALSPRQTSEDSTVSTPRNGVKVEELKEAAESEESSESYTVELA